MVSQRALTIANRAHTRRGSFHLRYARLGVDGRFLGDLGAHDAHPVVGDVGRDEGDVVALDLIFACSVLRFCFKSARRASGDHPKPQFRMLATCCEALTEAQRRLT